MSEELSSSVDWEEMGGGVSNWTSGPKSSPSPPGGGYIVSEWRNWYSPLEREDDLMGSMLKMDWMIPWGNKSIVETLKFPLLACRL